MTATMTATMTLLTQFKLFCSSKTTHTPIVETTFSASQGYKLTDDFLKSNLIVEPPSLKVLLIRSKNLLLITVTGEPVSIIAFVVCPLSDTLIDIFWQSLLINGAISVSCSHVFSAIVVIFCVYFNFYSVIVHLVVLVVVVVIAVGVLIRSSLHPNRRLSLIDVCSLFAFKHLPPGSVYQFFLA